MLLSWLQSAVVTVVGQLDGDAFAIVGIVRDYELTLCRQTEAAITKTLDLLLSCGTIALPRGIAPPPAYQRSYPNTHSRM